MNCGELKDKICVLSIKQNDNRYEWDESSCVRAKTEHQKGYNLFSKVGRGAKSIKFTIRKNNNITLHNAFIWQGMHCFITDIIKTDRMYYEVLAALIEPKQCSVKRSSDTPLLDELNRPIEGTEQYTMTFPSCIVEKYVKQTTEEPMSTVESVYVLVTPKVIELIHGEVVTILEKDYEVLTSHTLDEYKNEYEIRERRES